MVDRSLETLAADRGITICFTELDGIDGLWLPEERTILVSNRLNDRRAAEVLEHELTHVDIEDGHAALDAAVRRRASRTRFVAASAAAASLALLVGVRVGFSPHPTGDAHQMPPPQAGLTTAAPQTDQRRPPVGSTGPATRVVTQVYGGVRYRTVTVTPTSTPAPALRTTGTTRPAGPSVPAGAARTTTPVVSAPPSSSGPPPTTTVSSSPSPSPTVPAGTTVERPRSK